MITYESFLVGPQSSFIFAFVPKAACTNWKIIIRYLYGHKDYLSSSKAHAEGIDAIPNIINSNAHPVRLLRDSSIRKFTCVRNPFTRLLSAYLNKIKRFYEDADESYLNSFGKLLKEVDEFRMAVLPEKQYIDFETFIHWLECSDFHSWYPNNLHWRPQTQIIGCGQIQFDYIAKLENLSTDAPLILDAIRCDIPFPSQEEIRFPSTHANKLIHSYYTPDLVERVVRLYNSDFDFLGYSKRINDLS